VLNYFGQGALLLSDPSAASNPFYRLAPAWATVPLVALATRATVIASQALISGAFSLTHQAIQLGYAPRLAISHTSAEERGQIYVAPRELDARDRGVRARDRLRSSSNLAAAYGMSVTANMAITTVLLCVVAYERWGWRRGASRSASRSCRSTSRSSARTCSSCRTAAGSRCVVAADRVRADEHLEARPRGAARAARGGLAAARPVPARPRDVDAAARARHRGVPDRRPGGTPPRCSTTSSTTRSCTSARSCSRCSPRTCRTSSEAERSP
jgi:hypothetical protein